MGQETLNSANQSHVYMEASSWLVSSPLPHSLPSPWGGGSLCALGSASPPSHRQPWGPRCVHSTAGVDEDLYGPVEGVPVGQGDDDALGRACGRGGIGSDLVGGTLYP